jgi:hypothetical protein
MSMESYDIYTFEKRAEKLIDLQESLIKAD